MACARGLLLVLHGAVAVSVSACDSRAPTSPADPVGVVYISLDGIAYRSHAFLTVGDCDTVFAQASTNRWPWHTKYSSVIEPWRFEFSSSNPSVASVNAMGIVTALAVGATDLIVSADGVRSEPIRLSVSPPAESLTAEPARREARPGDTFAISIRALDARGQSVPDVIFNVGLDTTYWAVTTVPNEGTWMLHTPALLHLRARMVGRVRIIATVQHERRDLRFQAAVAVEVVQP